MKKSELKQLIKSVLSEDISSKQDERKKKLSIKKLAKLKSVLETATVNLQKEYDKIAEMNNIISYDDCSDKDFISYITSNLDKAIHYTKLVKDGLEPK